MSYSSSASSSLVSNPVVLSSGNQGLVVQSPDVSPVPTIRVTETTSNFSLYVIPNSDSGQYNPLDTEDSVELVSTTNVVGQSGGANTTRLALTTHSFVCNGLRLSGIPGDEYAEIGCGGTGSEPTQRIRFDETLSAMQMAYTNWQITTPPLPATAGAAAGVYLPISINGVQYKIALQADA